MESEVIPSPVSAEAPSNLPTGSSVARKNSRKRIRCRSTATTLPEPDEPPEVESLSEGKSSDENPLSEGETEANRSKEQRYEESRSMYRTKAIFYPELLQPKHRPLSPKFITMAATERYQSLRHKKFINQQRRSLTDENLADVRKIVIDAGLIRTLTDYDSYQPNVVREFIANLYDAEERDDGVSVYVRGSMVDFSPSLINSLYCIPRFEEDPNWMEVNIDEVCGFLTDGQIQRPALGKHEL